MKHMAINPINTHPITTMHSNDPEVLVCKCGNEPYPSAEFYYKSKYSEETTIGIIARVDRTHIVSTNGTPYHKNEVEVKIEVEEVLELDPILEKISKFGVNSLTKREKDFLDNL
jgi:hypothetical protein